MRTFAHIIHPIHPKRDIARKPPFNLFSHLPTSWIDFFSLFFPAMTVAYVDGIASPAGQQARGWLVACPLTPTRMLQIKTEKAYTKIVEAGLKSAGLGAEIIGLGAFTSVVGDAGVSVAQRLNGQVAVTTGNSYVVATTLRYIKKATQCMDVDLSSAETAVIGATGSIGKACARLLAEQVPCLTLIGRNETSLNTVAEQIRKESPTCRVKVAADITQISTADIILSATSSPKPVIDSPDLLKPGAVVCDIAQPQDVSQAAASRHDVLVFEGDKVIMPGSVRFKPGSPFGFSEKLTYACMAEVIILALENRPENYTLGREIALGKIKEIDLLGEKHGFEPGNYYAFNRLITQEEIQQIRQNAKRG